MFKKLWKWLNSDPVVNFIMKYEFTFKVYAVLLMLLFLFVEYHFLNICTLEPPLVHMLVLIVPYGAFSWLLFLGYPVYQDAHGEDQLRTWKNRFFQLFLAIIGAALVYHPIWMIMQEDARELINMSCR